MSERKDAPKSKFFRLKNDTSRIIKNDFDFFKLEEQESLDNDSVIPLKQAQTLQ